MPVKPCLVCGALSKGSYCPTHAKPKGAWSRRDNTTHVRWARAVKRRDHHRCTVCGTTEHLHAHHVRPGWDLDAGITLCKAHHKEQDPYAR